MNRPVIKMEVEIVTVVMMERAMDVNDTSFGQRYVVESTDFCMFVPMFWEAGWPGILK